MARTSLDRHFEAYCERGDMLALAEVFDEVAPELLRVARHLASPSTEPHDLVQTTFLVAIQRAAAWDPERPVKQWLLGILAKEAAYERRRGSRVVEPDRLDERPPADPESTAGDREFAAALERALDELPDKYREVVRPVIVDGLSPRDVARAVGQRPGTVRVQLHRGLRLLRDALPAGFALGALVSTQSPGLAAVRTKVLVSGASHGTGAASVAVGGTLGLAAAWAVSARGRLAVAGAVGALAVGGFVWRGALAPKAGPAGLSLSRSVALAAESGPALGGRGPGRTAVAPTGDLSLAQEAELSTVQVTGRVLDLGLQAASDATVELELTGAGRFAGRTDGHGDFRIQVVLGSEASWSGSVRASDGTAAEARALTLNARQREAHLGTFQLGSAAPVRVRAEDADGRALAGVEVELVSTRLAGARGPGSLVVGRGSTGAGGQLELPAVPRGPLELRARLGELAGRTEIEGPRARAAAVVRLEPAGREALVQPAREDAWQAKPVHALVRLSSPAGPVWSPGAGVLEAGAPLEIAQNGDGELELVFAEPAPGPGETVLLAVDVPGFHPTSQLVTLRERGLPNPVDVRLEPRTSLLLELRRDPALKLELELQRFDVGIGDFGPSGRDWGGLGSPNTPEGLFRFDGLLPGTYRVRERSSDLVSSEFDVREGDELLSLDFDLTVLRSVEGRVVAPDPELLPQVSIVVEGEGLSDSPNRWMPRQRFQWLVRPDAEGRFSLRLPTDRPVRLLAYHPRLVLTSGPVDPFAVPEVVLELAYGDELALALHELAAEHELDRLRVFLYRDLPAGAWPAGAPEARLYPRVDEGVARFAGVPPGTWTLFVDPGPRTGVEPAVLRGVTVVAGRSLELPEPSFAPGGRVLVDLAGRAPPTRMTLVARSHGEPEYVRTQSFEAGQVLELTGLGPGRFTVWSQLPTKTGLALREEVELGLNGRATLIAPAD